MQIDKVQADLIDNSCDVEKSKDLIDCYDIRSGKYVNKDTNVNDGEITKTLATNDDKKVLSHKSSNGSLNKNAENESHSTTEKSNPDTNKKGDVDIQGRDSNEQDLKSGDDVNDDCIEESNCNPESYDVSFPLKPETSANVVLSTVNEGKETTVNSSVSFYFSFKF